MGRKPSRWANLPKGMRARPRSQKIFYYLDTGEKPRREIPLGSDYVQTVAKWAELTSRPAPPTEADPITFVDAVNGRGKVAGYPKDVLPTKAPRTQQGNEDELVWLLTFFGDPPALLDSVEPVHVQQYMDWRVEQTRAAAEARNAKRRADGGPRMLRRSALTIPAVTVCWNPSGLPMAMAMSPCLSSDERPRVAATSAPRDKPSTCSTARSV
jgi:hypothetical protein